MAGAPGTQVYAADGMVAAAVGDETSAEKVPLVIARRLAKTASYVSIIEPYSNAPIIRNIIPLNAMVNGKATNPQDAFGLQIERGKTNDLLLFSNPRGAKRIGDYTFDGGIAWLTQTDGRLESFYLGAGTQLANANWSVNLETLVTAGDSAQMGILIERAAQNRWMVWNGGAAATLELNGLVKGNLEGFRLDAQGNRREKILPIESSDGMIRLFLNPRMSYEIVGGLF